MRKSAREAKKPEIYNPTTGRSGPFLEDQLSSEEEIEEDEGSVTFDRILNTSKK